jgi:hypothetical protein
MLFLKCEYEDNKLLQTGVGIGLRFSCTGKMMRLLLHFRPHLYGLLYTV